jgi:hypothetical protein
MILSRIKTVASVVAEMGAEFFAGIIADRVEGIVKNRRELHVHAPRMVKIGSIESAEETLDVLTVLIGRKHQHLQAVKTITRAAVRVCRDCGELYFYEEK